MIDDKKYMLDLAMQRNNPFFFIFLICLKEKKCISEKEICEKLFIGRNELETFAVFQEDIGYFDYVLDSNNNIVFSIRKRGLEAYENLSYNRDIFINSLNAYNEYVNRNAKSKVKSNYLKENK